MKHRTAITKNLERFEQIVDDLLYRPHGTEGMGLLWGRPGEGKTTAVAHVADKFNGYFVRAIGCWTVTSMLSALCEAVGGERKLRRSDMVLQIVDKLAFEDDAKQIPAEPRPIFVDEADYLFRQWDMLDALRDIYDMSGCPIILIGMEDIAKKIQGNGRFGRRMTQWVEFKGLDLEDARCVADTCCEIQVADCLLGHLYKEANANIGRIIIGLSRVEKMALKSGLDTVTLTAWGDRPLFYDQPVFGQKKARADRQIS